MNAHRAMLAALSVYAGCVNQSDAAKKPVIRAAATRTAPQDTVVPSPNMSFDAAVPAGDDPVSVSTSRTRAEALAVVNARGGIPYLVRWPAGSPALFFSAELPAGFQWTSIVTHPTKTAYFLAGSGKTGGLIVLATPAAPRWTIQLLHQSPREITHLIVSPQPFETDSGTFYRLFYAETLANGGSSLRSITERGGLEYQVIGPASEVLAKSVGREQTGAKTAPFATPIAFDKSNRLLWQDERGCAHAFAYDHGWANDQLVANVPCGGTLVPTPSGNAFLNWHHGQAGVEVVTPGAPPKKQATALTFIFPPVPAPDGKGIIGIATKESRYEMEFVRLDLP